MKKRLLYIAYIVFFVLTVFGGIEIYLNYLLNHPESCPDGWKDTLVQYYLEHDAHFIQQENEMAHYDEELFYTLKPGEFVFENREFETPFKVNSLGCRDDEASLENPEVVMLGDSYGMGWGANQDKTYAQLVEGKLGMKVLNAGISSYGTPRELEILKRIDTDSLKYLVIQYCSNDNYEITEYVQNNDGLVISSEQVYDSICDLVQSRNSYYPFKYVVELLPHLILSKSDDISVKPKKEGGEEISISKSFLEMIKNSKEISPDVNIILFTLDKHGFENWFMEEVQRILNQSFGSSLHDRVRFINFSDDLSKEDYFILDGHINEQGHQLVADSLIELIASDSFESYHKQFLYDNGNVCIDATYINHIKNGITTYYWEDGAVSQTTNYTKGVKNGEEIRYDQSGVEMERKWYKNGEEVKVE